jgi:hypothetical protein
MHGSTSKGMHYILHLNNAYWNIFTIQTVGFQKWHFLSTNLLQVVCTIKWIGNKAS